MDIGLMAHIEHKAVCRRIEDIVHRQRQLYHAQIRPDMSARL